MDLRSLGKCSNQKQKKMRLTKQLKTDVVIFVEDLKVKKKKKWRENFIFETSNKEKHGEGWELNVWDTEPS